MNLLKKSLFILLSLIIFNGGCALINPYPTDETLTENFRKNKANFERLVTMFQEDSQLLRVSGEDGAWKSFDQKATISAPRLSEYKSLLLLLDVENIYRNEQQKDIYLKVWGVKSNFIGGKSKYYVFSQSENLDTVESLDEIYLNGRDANEMKEIEGNWYLYLDIW